MLESRYITTASEWAQTDRQARNSTALLAAVLVALRGVDRDWPSPLPLASVTSWTVQVAGPDAVTVCADLAGRPSMREHKHVGPQTQTQTAVSPLQQYLIGASYIKVYSLEDVAHGSKDLEDSGAKQHSTPHK